MRLSKVVAFAAAAALPFTAARADEGMWTFDAFPAAKMQADYGWAPDQAWLDRVRNAAVRLTGGCSASFVSADGLILTNHHCVAGCPEQNSTAKLDILDNGFTAATAPTRSKCPGQQAEVVTAIRDVTPRREGRDRQRDRPGRGQGAKTPPSPRSRRPAAPTPRSRAARSSRSTAAGSTSSTPIANTATSGSSGRPRRRRRSSAATPTISTSRATRSMPLPARLRERPAGRDAAASHMDARARRSRAKRPSSSATPDRPSGC